MSILETFSNELADLVTGAAPSVVQVLGARRPASGVVHGADTVITTARALGREDGLRVRLPGSGDAGIDADLGGWDPATGIAVLRTRTPFDAPRPSIADREPRTGEVVLAIGRSWSNAVTASAGIVAIVGGPLRTGRRREIPRVFRITSPIHNGFAGGGIFDASGRLTGIATASAIRGLAIGIPSSIALASVTQVLTTGTPRRGFLGVAVQPVQLPASQQPGGRNRALLIMGVTPGSPAETAGLMVGDLLLEFDGQPIATADDLLDLLVSDSVGREVTAQVLRGGTQRDLPIAVSEGPRSPAKG
jgi:S1-C subfamily serine protease